MAAVHVLIAGVAEDLDGLIDYIPSIRRNIAAIEVPAMTTPEVEEILRIGSETSGMTFADGSAERIANYAGGSRSEEHTSELQSLMRNSYAVFFLKKKKKQNRTNKPEKPQPTNKQHHSQM